MFLVRLQNDIVLIFHVIWFTGQIVDGGLLAGPLGFQGGHLVCIDQIKSLQNTHFVFYNQTIKYIWTMPTNKEEKRPSPPLSFQYTGKDYILAKKKSLA